MQSWKETPEKAEEVNSTNADITNAEISQLILNGH
jgi:hypothetical protein